MTTSVSKGLQSIRKLGDEFLPILSARNEADLERSLQRFAAISGFERYSLLVIHDDFGGENSFVPLSRLHNTPPEYFSTWASVDCAQLDPVAQHCKRSDLPIIYGQDTYVRLGAADEWDLQAQFGFACGISTAFHLPQDQHVMLGLDRRDELPQDQVELGAFVARFQLFGTFIQCAALNVLNACSALVPPVASSMRLSPREYECLQWAAEGKTAWETGKLLSIAEATVAKILASALRKLDCATKPQAVVKALRLGLIH